MTAERETPASQRRQAEGNTGVTSSRDSVPGWAQKRARRSLVHFRGEYLSPEALSARMAAEAAASRDGGVGGAPPTVTLSPVGGCDGGTPGAAELERPGIPLADRPYPSGRVDRETGEILPCRSLETTQPGKGANVLSGPHRKVASALSWNVAHLCRQYGVERVGFLTLTFADHVTCAREASKRFNSLASHVLRERYAAYIRVLERQKSGRIHYHLLVVLADDIRTGSDFDAFSVRDYKSANNHLRREWAFWRHTAPQYRFGRTELMPVKSNADALGQYVGKYIGKHIGFREERDKGVRLVSYSGDARMATSKHTAISNHPESWRAKVLTFSRQVEAWKRAKNPHCPPVRCLDDLAFHLGKRWAYQWREYIAALPPADLSIPF